MCVWQSGSGLEQWIEFEGGQKLSFNNSQLFLIDIWTLTQIFKMQKLGSQAHQSYANCFKGHEQM